MSVTRSSIRRKGITNERGGRREGGEKSDMRKEEEKMEASVHFFACAKFPPFPTSYYLVLIPLLIPLPPLLHSLSLDDLIAASSSAYPPTSHPTSLLEKSYPPLPFSPEPSQPAKKKETTDETTLSHFFCTASPYLHYIDRTFVMFPHFSPLSIFLAGEAVTGEKK